MTKRGKWTLALCACAAAAVVVLGLVLHKRLAGVSPGVVVTGLVLDSTARKPIAGAVVSDDHYGPKPFRNATTDSDGRYRYTTWDEEHRVTAKASGYMPQTLTFVSSGETMVTLDFKLTPVGAGMVGMPAGVPSDTPASKDVGKDTRADEPIAKAYETPGESSGDTVRDPAGIEIIGQEIAARAAK